MSTTLKTGDKAPAFTAKDQKGNLVKLTDFKGKKVVLYFYPKDDTPGCTKEACNFRDNFNLLKKKGIEVIGISTDSVKSHGKFADKYELPFTLVADEDKTIVTAYGVWGEKKFMGKTYMGTSRTTFIINEKGIIEHIITKVDTTNSTEQVLELIEA
jgi:peroxiredoxin Q/BCP